jgi:energy-coupling factor transporter ATP-binding protein EcfA2
MTDPGGAPEEPTAGPTGTPRLLELDGVTYRYAGASEPALRGVDLRVRPSEVVGVVGATESGKSTLALVAAGLAPATVGGRLEGTVRIDGVDTSSARPHEIAQRCAVVFQDPSTQLSGTVPTVWEEVAFGPCNLGLPLAEVVERVEVALRSLRLEALADRDPSRLSGGQAQLVAVAAALAMRPAYLILDEPTAQLDPHGTALVAAALASLAAEGTSLILIEQKTDVIASVADRVLVLVDGAVAMEGSATAVLGDERLRAFGVEPPSELRLANALAAAGLPVPDVLRTWSGRT